MKKVKSNVVEYRRDAIIYSRVGMKLFDKGVRDRALKHLYRAVELEPFNPDCKFNLAGVLTEMRELEKSNSLLLDILKNIDPTLTECYFGLACNYFDLGNFKKAREYFEKYIYYSPNGQFSDEVYDALYYLQIYDDVGMNSKRGKYVLSLIKDGRKLVKSGEYEKACKKFEKAVETSPELITPRNELSLAHFHTGNLMMATGLACSVLKLDKKNIPANCNLAVFYFHSGEKELFSQQLKKLVRLKPKTPEDLERLANAYITLGDAQKAAGALSENVGIIRERPLLYGLLGLLMFNLDRYDEAVGIWTDIKQRFWWCGSVAERFLARFEERHAGEQELPYIGFFEDTYSRYPMGATFDYMEEYGALGRKYGKDKTEEIAGMIAGFDEAERRKTVEYLSECAFQDSGSEEERAVPRSGAGAAVPAKELIDGEAVRIRWNKDWEAVIECAFRMKERVYKAGYKKEIKSLWMNYIKRVYPDRVPVIKDSESWAAALEYLYCSAHLIRVSKVALARKYNISASMLSSRLRDFKA